MTSPSKLQREYLKRAQSHSFTPLFRQIGRSKGELDFHLDDVEKLVWELAEKYFYSKNRSSFAQKSLLKHGHIASGVLIDAGLMPLWEVNQAKGSLKMVIDPPPYWQAIDDRRKPSRRSGGGSGTLYQAIYKWISFKPEIQIRISEYAADRGVDFERAKRTFAFLITRKIHKFGFAPQTKFLTGQFTPFMNELSSRMPEAMKASVTMMVSTAFGKHKTFKKVS